MPTYHPSDRLAALLFIGAFVLAWGFSLTIHFLVKGGFIP